MSGGMRSERHVLVRFQEPHCISVCSTARPLPRLLSALDVREFQQETDEGGTPPSTHQKWFRRKVDVERHLKLVGHQLTLMEQSVERASTRIGRDLGLVAQDRKWEPRNSKSHPEILEAI